MLKTPPFSHKLAHTHTVKKNIYMNLTQQCIHQYFGHISMDRFWYTADMKLHFNVAECNPFSIP